MKVWIDQDLCTGDGLCEEIAPDVFTLLDDGLAYVKEGDKVYATAKGNPQGAEGMAELPRRSARRRDRERRGVPRRVHLHRALISHRSSTGGALRGAFVRVRGPLSRESSRRRGGTR